MTELLPRSMDYDDRIVKTVPRTDKISLRCRNHPNLKWRTKNIGCIGARSIFFVYQSDTDIECDCPMSDLYIDPIQEPE